MHSLTKGARFLLQRTYGQTPSLIYVGGWHGRRNLGDEALFAAYQKLFRPAKLVEFSGGLATPILKHCYRKPPAAVLAGGTLINRGKQWLQYVQEYLSSGGEIYCFGTGVADSDFWARSPSYRDRSAEWAAALRKFSYLGVRGPQSARVLETWGLQAEVIGDPAIFFVKDSIPSRRDDGKMLGLNIASNEIMWAPRKEIAKIYVELVTLARRKGWRVEWFVISPSDLALTCDLARETGTQDKVHVIYQNTAQFLEDVGKMSVFVGMKLHSVVLALCALVPSIMVEYEPKCRDFMQSIGQERFCIRADKMHAEQIWDLVVQLNESRVKHVASTLASLTSIKLKQRRMVRRLMGVPSEAC